MFYIIFFNKWYKILKIANELTGWTISIEIVSR
jgi:hypothetical protein